MHNKPTVLIIPGLRDESEDHWQTLLHAQLQTKGVKVQSVSPIGKAQLSCQERVDGLTRAVGRIEGPLVLVAHSGACITVAHWVHQGADTKNIVGALLAVPPDFDQTLPSPYPSWAQLNAHGWLPTPRIRLPFHSKVACSDNDPLAKLDRVEALASHWGSKIIYLGSVGHLNPASGFGPWPVAETLIDEWMN